MKAKTFHDLYPPEDGREASGAISHVFHRHGPLIHGAEDRAVYERSGTVGFPLTTDTEKTVAYGTIATGDRMILPNANADKTLIVALQLATGHRLMAGIGAHQGDIAIRTTFINPESGTYWAALEAMAHFGTANQASILKTVRQRLLQQGLKHQASILKSLIAGAVDMAMAADHVGLDWFYRQFHSLYGNPKNPNPQADGQPVSVPEPPAEIPEIPLPVSVTFNEGTTWGPMDTVAIPLDAWKHPRIRSKASWRYSEFGVFKYPWRALPSSDYCCFSLRRYRYGGTLLIDMSGSMAIDQSQLDRVLNLAPYATIAAYGSNPEDRNHGRLVVLARDMKKGLASHARAVIGKGNVVDGPALQWLAHESAPRIWMSDGAVTGVGDHGSAALHRHAAAICQGAKILRIPSLGELIARLTS